MGMTPVRACSLRIWQSEVSGIQGMGVGALRKECGGASRGLAVAIREGRAEGGSRMSGRRGLTRWTAVRGGNAGLMSA
eukprot:7214551-Alexandrium_andersonii.AAC.1